MGISVFLENSMLNGNPLTSSTTSGFIFVYFLPILLIELLNIVILQKYNMSNIIYTLKVDIKSEGHKKR